MLNSPLDAAPLVCPHDGLPLARAVGTLRCASGHAFDIARQGYVHLLPVGFKASREPGDDASMVAARRRVLDSGLFAPVAQVLLEAARQALHGSDISDIVVDAGCGEGHYTAALAAALPGRCVLGLDVSRPAILAAVKRHRALAWVVASNRRPPVAPGRVAMFACLFGFPTWVAWAAHQRPGQCVVTIDPGPHHLIELRERLYPTVRLHAPPDDRHALQAGYRCVAQRTLGCAGTLSNAADLLEMTPHGRRADAAARARVSDTPFDRMSVDVLLRCWRRC